MLETRRVVPPWRVYQVCHAADSISRPYQMAFPTWFAAVFVFTAPLAASGASDRPDEPHLLLVVQRAGFAFVATRQFDSRNRLVILAEFVASCNLSVALIDSSRRDSSTTVNAPDIRTHMRVSSLAVSGLTRVAACPVEHSPPNHAPTIYN